MNLIDIRALVGPILPPSFHSITKGNMHNIFWCNVCDSKQVDASDKSSGTFYRVFGHKQEAGKIIEKYDEGEHCCVIFAICSDCNPLESLKEVK